MKTIVIAGIVLIAAGVLCLLYGRFTYTKDTQAAKIGPIELTISEKETVNIPNWAGVSLIAAGAIGLAYGATRRA